MFDIAETVKEWIAAEKRLALATVVATWGSAPRQAGAKMVVTTEPAMIGSVSGGCVETAVVEEMLQSLKSKKPRLLHYGVSDDTAWEVGLACGGKIDIFVEPLNLQWWQILAENQSSSFKTVSILSGDYLGTKVFLGQAVQSFPEIPAELLQKIQSIAENCAKTERVQAEDLDLLLEVYEPNPRLVIIGGAHVAMALNQYAKVLGYEVHLIDPRMAFATKERFPDVISLSHEYPHKALKDIPLDSNTFVAVLTHDPKIDDPALMTVLPSNAAYVGVLSSRRTHEKRLERLRENGLDPAFFSKIHTPIGLDIGAKTPEEIALSIMAEIVAVRNQKASS